MPHTLATVSTPRIPRPTGANDSPTPQEAHAGTLAGHMLARVTPAAERLPLPRASGALDEVRDHSLRLRELQTHLEAGRQTLPDRLLGDLLECLRFGVPHRRCVALLNMFLQECVTLNPEDKCDELVHQLFAKAQESYPEVTLPPADHRFLRNDRHFLALLAALDPHAGHADEVSLEDFLTVASADTNPRVLLDVGAGGEARLRMTDKFSPDTLSTWDDARNLVVRHALKSALDKAYGDACDCIPMLAALSLEARDLTSEAVRDVCAAAKAQRECMDLNQRKTLRDILSSEDACLSLSEPEPLPAEPLELRFAIEKQENFTGLRVVPGTEFSRVRFFDSPRDCLSFDLPWNTDTDAIYDIVLGLSEPLPSSVESLKLRFAVERHDDSICLRPDPEPGAKPIVFLPWRQDGLLHLELPPSLASDSPHPASDGPARGESAPLAAELMEPRFALEQNARFIGLRLGLGPERGFPFLYLDLPLRPASDSSHAAPDGSSPGEFGPSPGELVKLRFAIDQKARFIGLRPDSGPESERFYFLPWRQDGLQSIELPLDPAADSPHLFVTSALGGCGIGVQKSAEHIRVFHSTEGVPAMFGEGREPGSEDGDVRWLLADKFVEDCYKHFRGWREDIRFYACRPGFLAFFWGEYAYGPGEDSKRWHFYFQRGDADGWNFELDYS